MPVLSMSFATNTGNWSSQGDYRTDTARSGEHLRRTFDDVAFRIVGQPSEIRAIVTIDMDHAGVTGALRRDIVSSTEGSELLVVGAVNLDESGRLSRFLSRCRSVQQMATGNIGCH